MDGLETLEIIRKEHPDTSTVLMSVHWNKQIALKAFQLGAASFIQKPITLDNLLETIEDIIIKKKERKIYKIADGTRIPSAPYWSILLYPERPKAFRFLSSFCQDRVFRLIVAGTWQDILAAGFFISIIHPDALTDDAWSSLFDYVSYLAQEDKYERFVLLPGNHSIKIPRKLKRFFKVLSLGSDLEEYILYRAKIAQRRMTLRHRSNLLEQRRKDVKRLLTKDNLQKEFLINRLAKYYNVSNRTVRRDMAKIVMSSGLRGGK